MIGRLRSQRLLFRDVEANDLLRDVIACHYFKKLEGVLLYCFNFVAEVRADFELVKVQERAILLALVLD